MNISSVIIYTKALSKQMIEQIQSLQEVEIVTSADDRIVALISSENTDGEIATFRKLEAINGVISVAMVYSYQEEIEQDMLQLQTANPVSKILNDNNISAEMIVYNGHINDKDKPII